MADPVSALATVGTISNIVQLVEFTGRLLNQTQMLVRSSSGALKENVDLEVLIKEYEKLSVSVCETHAPIGNIRQQSFGEIWHSEKARRLRASIKSKDCYCTNEIFMWPSITFQPKHLAKALIGAKVWRKSAPLAADERADLRNSTAALSLPIVQLTREANK